MSSTPDTRLIWIDLEMTGLDTDNDKIIEIATIVTDDHLNILAERLRFWYRIMLKQLSSHQTYMIRN